MNAATMIRISVSVSRLFPAETEVLTGGDIQAVKAKARRAWKHRASSVNPYPHHDLRHEVWEQEICNIKAELLRRCDLPPAPVAEELSEEEETEVLVRWGLEGCHV